MKKYLIVLALVASFVPAGAFADHSVKTSKSSDSCFLSGANLTLGSRNQDVTCIQKYLVALGLLKTSVTGYYGNATRDAVVVWQHSMNIPATGFFGIRSRETYAAMQTNAASYMEMLEEAQNQLHSGTSTRSSESIGMMGMHAHESIDVSAWSSRPIIALHIQDDAMGGWNVHISPQNFRFAPEHVNGEVMQNEGHVHIYVDSVKIARIYGPWFHLPNTFAKGSHEVRVTLNANDHSELSLNGTVIEATSTIVVM